LGERIADERFSLTDHPLLDFASSSGRYDGEGVPHRITPIVENGVIRNFLYDLDAAARSGVQSTGNGVGCEPTNLVLAEGDTSFDDMVRSTDYGLLVDSVMGLGQGNVLSGAFSVNVYLGYKIDGGRIVGRVKDVMLAGNTYDAIQNIRAIGDRAEWTSGSAGSSVLTPPVQIEKLSVVGK
jgi:PmbA protein